ncbi:hypothetical protein L2Y96_07305 [Luteibacter aegosomaticola]|uniref:XVIPCD domain-containing protein n=1 Tax=Luteibacter aegosomaticola TaxID=2911538 RepID=UPI001FFAF95B|nr:XVIPCD domain-containing protein [Luteibacter aegosomaticola]UPG91569.1 hypothetical protein L2Y96_07305 [Luteibacter aegosomaticola]
MTTTTDSYAFLADDAYVPRMDGQEVQHGQRHFVIEDSAMDITTGFYARTYRDVDSGELIIAFCGTDDLLDAVVDVAMVNSRIDLQAYESEQYTRRTIGELAEKLHMSPESLPISVTGHSLGGGLAQLSAEKFGIRGETFNAYGIVGLRGHDDRGDDRIINHVRATDVVSAASEHYGEVRVYATAADIETIKAAGYADQRDHRLIDALSWRNVEAHASKSFVNSSTGPGIINSVTTERYQENKTSIDAFRNDILTGRIQLTSNLEHPELIGVRALEQPVKAVGSVAIANAVVAGDQLVRDARALRDGGREVLKAAQSAISHVSDRFSDPNIATALGGASYGAPAHSPPPSGEDLRKADHPGHQLYTQAHREVSAIDQQLGRSPDANTDRLAGAISVAAAREGFNRIDHVVLNGDGSKAFGVQGDLGSPFKRYVEVGTAQAMSTPLEQSSREWHAAAATRDQDAQSQAQQATQTQQAAIRPHGP